MRLDFNVLWIDDQPQAARSFQERLDIEARNKGFKLNITNALSFEQAESYLGENVFLDNIDLVLVDYHLGEKYLAGDEVIAEIRHAVPYKDIILYSAIETDGLAKKVLEQEIEGVFCAYRGTLAETIVGVFNALVKKVLDIDHCRGIVMGVTSDIDHIILECLSRLSNKISENNSQTALKYAIEKIDERLGRSRDVREGFEVNRSLSALLVNHELFTANDRLRLLKKMLTLHYQQEYKEIDILIAQYMKEVIPHRNQLGHVRLVAEGGAHALKGADVKTVTLEDLTKMRQDLIIYRDKFEELLVILGDSSG